MKVEEEMKDHKKTIISVLTTTAKLLKNVFELKEDEKDQGDDEVGFVDVFNQAKLAAFKENWRKLSLWTNTDTPEKDLVELAIWYEVQRKRPGKALKIIKDQLKPKDIATAPSKKLLA